VNTSIRGYNLKTAVQRAMAVNVIQKNNAFRIEKEQRENLNSVQKRDSRKII